MLSGNLFFSLSYVSQTPLHVNTANEDFQIASSISKLECTKMKKSRKYVLS